MPKLISTAFRRALYQRGLTPQPVCPCCQEQHAASSFTKAGICKLCDLSIQAAERAAAEARLDELDGRLWELWQAQHERPNDETIDHEMAVLEGERWDLIAIVDPNAFSRASEPPSDWHPPVCDPTALGTGPFLPEDDA